MGRGSTVDTIVKSDPYFMDLLFPFDGEADGETGGENGGERMGGEDGRGGEDGVRGQGEENWW